MPTEPRVEVHCPGDQGHNENLHREAALAVAIRHYRPEDKEAFLELNLDWIEEYFTVEDADREQLEQLEDTIIGRGGLILVAELDGVVVGTAALQPPPHAPDDGLTWYEVIKLATRKEHRRQGVGRRILEQLMAEAKSLGADALWLETNSTLKSAIRLYERIGFQHLPGDDFWPTPYERCNVQMVRTFE